MKISQSCTETGMHLSSRWLLKYKSSVNRWYLLSNIPLFLTRFLFGSLLRKKEPEPCSLEFQIVPQQNTLPWGLSSFSLAVYFCFAQVFLFVLFCFWTRSVVVFQKLWDVCCWASFMKITRLPNVVCQACQLARHNGCQRSFASCIACKYIRGWKLWAFQGPQLTCCIVLRKVERWNTQVKEFFDFLFCGLPMGTAV